MKLSENYDIFKPDPRDSVQSVHLHNSPNVSCVSSKLLLKRHQDISRSEIATLAGSAEVALWERRWIATRSGEWLRVLSDKNSSLVHNEPLGLNGDITKFGPWVSLNDVSESVSELCTSIHSELLVIYLSLVYAGCPITPPPPQLLNFETT